MSLELEELTGKIMELEKQGVRVEEQKEIKIFCGDKEIGVHRLDLIVAGQVISYLKAAKLKAGLLLNFSKSVLKIKRVMN